MILEILGIAAFVAGGYGFKKLHDHAGESLARKKGIRCPKCGSSEVKQNSGSSFQVNYGGGWKSMIDYKCKCCGHKFTRFE